MRSFVCLMVAVVLVAVPVAAEECSDQVMVGNFDIQFSGAVFDGFNTNFAYCVTGVETTGFKALSHWLLALDLACISGDDLVACGPEPCFYQVDDPTTGVTGIKWDDTEVEAGETQCFDFTLEGDWTDLIHETTVATKAGQEIAEVDGICGPVCFGCSSFVQVLNGETLQINTRLIHNRPPTVTTFITFTLVELARGGNNILAEWTEGPVTFEYGSHWEFLGPIPGVSSLPAGNYYLSIKANGMSGFKELRTKFRIK